MLKDNFREQKKLLIIARGVELHLDLMSLLKRVR